MANAIIYFIHDTIIDTLTSIQWVKFIVNSVHLAACNLMNETTVCA